MDTKEQQDENEQIEHNDRKKEENQKQLKIEVHTHEDGSVHYHGSNHTHVHSHQHTKAVLNRLSRAIGHLEAIKRMVEDGRDCSEVLIQLSAVRSAINNTSKVILEDHISHCIVDAIESGDNKVLEDLYKAIGYVMK